MFFSFSLFSQFQPSNLPNLKLWLKSDNVILNGTKVSQWTDLSGNNNHIIQNDANKQPLLMPSMLNGYPTVKFDGVNDNMKGMFAQTLSNQVTVFIIMNNLSSNSVFVYDGGTNYLSLIYNASNKVYIQSGTTNMFYAKSAPFPYVIFQNEYTTSSCRLF